MSELKPCPFCGGEAAIANLSNHYFVKCLKCWSNTAYFDTKAEAIEAWNTRHERTCRNAEGQLLGVFSCSKCGLTLDLCGDGCCSDSTMMFFEGRSIVRTLDMPNYCPNCGCRVKE